MSDSASIWENEYPKSSEYSHFYSTYVQLVHKRNILDTLNEQMHELYTFANTLPGEKALFAYQEGKWTPKEIIGHMIDTERVFAFRALAFARGDQASYPGMDQDEYMVGNAFNERTLSDIANEYLAVRIASLHLFKNMNNEQINRSGKASGVSFSVRSIPFIIAGHERYHLNFIKEKYL
ncbi:MAG: DinB family protein [Bacteroidota bacterium]